jgi:hypothetical protein
MPINNQYLESASGVIPYVFQSMTALVKEAVVQVTVHWSKLSAHCSRCRYHSGKSTGAKNPPIKYGMYTKGHIEERKWLNELIKEANQTADEMCD